MENQIYNSSVIVENYQVHYSFKRQTPQKHLNVWGKYYQWVHQQKQIQKFLEAYFIKNGKPKIGDEIHHDTQPAKIIIIQIDENYIRSELEQKFYEAELNLKTKK